MSVDTTLAVLYAQSGLSTNVANAAMVAPQASLAMTRVLVAEAARQERERVKRNEKTESTNVNPDGRQRGFFQTRSRARRRQEPEDNDSTRAKSPLVGNLLNVKV